MPVTNDGTFGEVESFVELLKMYLVKLGVVHAEQVLLVCDGVMVPLGSGIVCLPC
jgi:hypothetical protein